MSKLSNTIRKQVSKALNDYNMIADGDQIMVACSGGNYVGQTQKCKQIRKRRL